MIHPKNVTLHDTIKFMEVNIRASPGRETLAQMCGTQDPALIDGLLAFRSLLTRIYADADVLQGKDDKAKFNSLHKTMLLFYTCAVFGELAQQGDQPEIVIDKPALLSKYKRGSLSKKTKLLGHHGIVMQWLSVTGDKSSQSKAAVLSTTFPQDAKLVPAVKYLADTINAIEPIERAELAQEVIC